MAAKESSEPINISVISAIDNNDISKLEIAYLKEILEEEDIMDYIKTLKEHLIPWISNII